MEINDSINNINSQLNCSVVQQVQISPFEATKITPMTYPPINPSLNNSTLFQPIYPNSFVPLDVKPLTLQPVIVTPEHLKIPPMMSPIPQSIINQPIFTEEIIEDNPVNQENEIRFDEEVIPENEDEKNNGEEEINYDEDPYENTQENLINTLKAQPVYNLKSKGYGITPTEMQSIVQSAMIVYQDDIFPLSNNTARRIKKRLGGDWLVIVYQEGKPIDFNLTSIQGKDYMYFTLDTTAFQICRLR